MQSFQSFIIEAGRVNSKADLQYPHLAFDEKGRVKHQTPEERLDSLLSNTPREGDAEHAKLHAIIDKMETHHSALAPQKAQIARIVANGGTYDDLQRFLPDMAYNTIAVNIVKIRNIIGDYHQTRTPVAERVNLPDVMGSSRSKDFALPGNVSLEGFLRHPKLKNDLDTLTRSEFYDKHLTQFHSEERTWGDLTTLNAYDSYNGDSRRKVHPLQGIVAAKISKARKYHGIASKLEDREDLAHRISAGHNASYNSGARTLRDLRKK